MTTPDPIYVDSHNIIKLDDLKDDAGTAIIDATVTAVVYDSAGREVTGHTWPQSLTHTAGGDYEGTVPNTMDLKKGGLYTVKRTATDTGGTVRVFETDHVGT